jgi:hypothetical protein
MITWKVAARVLLGERLVMRVNAKESEDRLESGDTHEARDLTRGDIDCGAGHETCDSGYRDELHHPT